MEFQTVYNSKPRPPKICTGGKTQKHFRNEVNINTIMEKARKTGKLPIATGKAYFGDFTGMADYQFMQTQIAMAFQGFAQLSSKIRTRFDNDPGKLIEFLNNEENKDEAIRLGIMAKPKIVADPGLPGPDNPAKGGGVKPGEGAKAQ
ncbi:MAG: internal scaffolding protein [Arizlama microvirus]|nr:MAG: internal scaffolding protein [Arizlama microvirus]